MSFRKNILKILVIAAWVVVASGAITLLIAAMRKKDHQLCKGYSINIKGPQEEFFIDKSDVETILFDSNRNIANQSVESFNLRKMESKLKTNAWVKDAELYFDNNGILKINVLEREPEARIFTITGSSYYVDSSCAQLPLSDKFSAHLPVFTGFPTDRSRLNKNDSLLMRQIVHISQFINKDAFWKDQVEQIDISQAGTFEMIPLIGNHTVALGDGKDIEKKFRRLFLFYKQVMSKAGFDSYKKLDVQFARQVVATRNEAPLSKKDSLMAIAKVKAMIEEARQLQPDTLLQKNIKPIERLNLSEETLKNYDLVNEDSVTILRSEAIKQINKKPRNN